MPTAIIHLDGEEFMRVWDDRGRRMFEEICTDVPDWREAALFVWQPRHGFYLREIWRSR